jgi:hypothetical protein
VSHLRITEFFIGIMWWFKGSTECTGQEVLRFIPIKTASRQSATLDELQPRCRKHEDNRAVFCPTSSKSAWPASPFNLGDEPAVPNRSFSG